MYYADWNLGHVYICCWTDYWNAVIVRQYKLYVVMCNMYCIIYAIWSDFILFFDFFNTLLIDDRHIYYNHICNLEKRKG